MHWKKSLLVIQKILKLFPNTLTVDDNHYLLNRENLTQSIQMKLYQKQKKFSEFFVTFLKTILNFKHMPKRMPLIADVYPEIPAAKNMVR